MNLDNAYTIVSAKILGIHFIVFFSSTHQKMSLSQCMICLNFHDCDPRRIQDDVV